MSTGVMNLQAQVESVLGALVKAATVELTKLFESRYRASDVDVGPTAGKAETKILETPDSLSTGDTKRSIGVQVEQDIYIPLHVFGPPVPSPDGDGLKEEQPEEGMGCLLPSEMVLAVDKSPFDSKSSPLKQQVVAETLDILELSLYEEHSAVDSEPQAESVLHGTWDETLKYGSTQSSPTKQKPLVVQPLDVTSDDVCGEKVNFVCPLVIKPESPAAKSKTSEKPVQAEPQEACVSPNKGAACTTPPSDGASAAAQVGVWQRVHEAKETKSDLHMKLKLTSLDEKLTRPCNVQLVNILTVRGDDAKGSNVKCDTCLPKDLRRHQALHTGHRICCFSPCGNGIWQLKKVVTHTRDGYVCSICHKTFKRRKILRRHQRFHTGEKPYSCSTCSKTFALRKSLRRHQRFHTGERPHTCTKCNKSFRLRENLKAHQRFHTGEKPFSCTLCGKTYRIMRNLEKHQCEGVFVPSFRTIAGL